MGSQMGELVPFLLPLLLGSEPPFSGLQPPSSSQKGPCDSPTSFSPPLSPTPPSLHFNLLSVLLAPITPSSPAPPLIPFLVF